MSFILVALIPLLIVAGLVAGGVALARRRGKDEGGLDAHSVRRFVVYAFALVLLVLAATGVTGLLTLIIPGGRTLVDTGVTELARSLAITVVATPGFVLVWRWITRTLDDPREQTALSWGIFLTITGTVFLIGGLIGLSSGILWLLGLEPNGQRMIALGVVWTAVWAWTRGQATRIPPARLETGLPLLGSLVGLFVAAGSLTALITTILTAAYDGLTATLAGAGQLAEPLGRAGVPLVLGGLVWWWHWLRDARHLEEAPGRTVYLLLAGVLAGVVASLTAAGSLLFSILEWFLGDPGARGAAAHFVDTPSQLAVTLVGLVVWSYHRSVVMERPDILETEAGRSYRYLLAGIGLIAAASGLGVVINALLGAFVAAVTDRSTVDLLLGGLTALALGGPVWWRTWLATQRRAAADQAEIGSPSRRVYLTALAGIGGVVALIAIIILLFRLLEGVLEGSRAAVVIDEIRAPLGLVIATAVVAAYHLAVWKRERAAVAEVAPSPLKRVVLVAASPAVADLERALDVPVIGWQRADRQEDHVDTDRLAAEIIALDAEEVLAIVDGDRVEVIPLAP